MADINKEKYKAAILMIVNRTNKLQLGTTKLAKMLYYLDFINYRENETTVTGEKYYKHDYGPLGGDFYEVIGELIKEDKIRKKTKEIDDEEVHTYIALEEVGEERKDELFTEEEHKLLRKVINKYKDEDLDAIIAKSHLELPWRKAEEAGEVDPEYADDIDDFDAEKKEKYKEENKKFKEAFEKVVESKEQEVCK